VQPNKQGRVVTTDDLRALIDRLAGLSLPGLEKSLPSIVARRSEPEWLSRYRALRQSLDGKPETFWVDALIRYAEGDREFLNSMEFKNAYAEAQYRRAGVLYKLGGNEALTAKAYLRSALVFRELKRPLQHRQALKNHGSVLAILGQERGSLVHFEQAIRSYETCIAVTDQEKEPKVWAELQSDLAYALRGIGLITNDRSVYSRAVSAYQAGARILRSDGVDPELWALIKNNLGATFALLGELESDPAALIQSIAAYQESLRIRTFEAHPELWLRTVTNIMHAEATLAEITRDPTRLRGAHNVLLKQLHAVETAGPSTVNLAQTYGQLGTNAQMLGEMNRQPCDFQAAINFYNMALAGFSNASQPLTEARLQAHRASSRFRLGEVTRDADLMSLALVEYEELEGRFRKAERPQLWAYWLQSLGKMRERLAVISRRAEHRVSARAAFESVLTVYRREIYPQQWAETSSALCRTLARTAETLEDWEHLSDLADDMVESIHELVLVGLSRAQQRSLLRTLQGIGDLAAFAHLRRRSPGRAFEVVALARAVGSDLAFRLASGNREGGGETKSEPFKRWQSLQIAIERQMRETLNQASKSQPVNAGQLEELSAAYQALMGSLQETGALKCERIDVVSFARTLKPDSVAALVFASEQGGGILLVTADANTLVPSAVIDLPQLTNQRIDALLNGNGQSGSGWLAAYERYRERSNSWDDVEVEHAVKAWNDDIEAVLPELWDLAMGPLAAWLRAQAPQAQEVHLLVPGLISGLPLHAARSSQEDRYFAETWAVSYLPSPRAMMQAKDFHRSQEASLLAITDPAGDIGADVNPAWPFFAAANRQSVRGDARIVAAALEKVREVTHVSFFCHGIWECSDPDLSHLIMADGSQLSAQELAAIDLRHVELVVLGACETALIGTRLAPDEFTGLPVSLLQAGVRSVAASQWLVDAGSSYALLHRMMQEHREGLTPARALQAAQKAFVAGELGPMEMLPSGAGALSRIRTLKPLTGPPTQSVHQSSDSVLPPRTAPFFWAAFAVIGQG